MNGQWWRSLANLDDEQKRVLGLDANGRYFVTGPAGCGKTNLLVLRARYLAKRQIQNYGVLVWNGPLERFLTSDADHGVNPAKVHTFVSWLQSQFWTVVGPPDGAPEDIGERRKFLSDKLHQHLVSTGTCDLIDTLLVDEVQDYSPVEIELFGMVARNLFLVGDIRQQIYRSEVLSQAVDSVVPKLNQIELTKHYRIGHSICRLADRIAKPSKGHRMIYEGCCYDEVKQPSTVRTFRGSLEQQLDAAAETITQQLDGYPGEFIGVMCPRNEDFREVADYFANEFSSSVIVQAPGRYGNFEPSRPIVCCSLHNGKGLEFRCVHILAADGLNKMPRNRELIYTGVTRARTSLVIYHDNDLLPYLADALAADKPPVPPPSPESLF